MAIPRFGSLGVEKFACLAMVLVGLFGIWAALKGYPSEPVWFFLDLGRGWLILQSALVVAGGVAAYRSRSLALALIGVAAALLFVTPIGQISFLPGLWMLICIGLRWRAFYGDHYGIPRDTFYDGT